MPNDSMTVGEAREWLAERARDGVSCPACDQFVKIYKRSISSAVAAAFVDFYRITRDNPKEWVHVPSFLVGRHGTGAMGGDFAKLRFWGLIEADESEQVKDADKKSSGFWRITELGERFALGEVAVPKYVHLYDGRQTAIDCTEMMTITDALTNKFSYSELMGVEHD